MAKPSNLEKELIWFGFAARRTNLSHKNSNIEALCLLTSYNTCICDIIE